MVRVLVACRLKISRSKSHKKSKTLHRGVTEDVILKMQTQRFIAKHWDESE